MKFTQITFEKLIAKVNYTMTNKKTIAIKLKKIYISNNIFFNRFQSFLQKIPSDSYFEAGCGKCPRIGPATNGKTHVFFDVDREALKNAETTISNQQKMRALTGNNYFISSMSELKKSFKFDTISLINSLHHHQDIKKLIFQIIFNDNQNNAPDIVLKLSTIFSTYKDKLADNGNLVIFEYGIKNPKGLFCTSELENKEIKSMFKGNRELFYKYHSQLKKHHFRYALKLAGFEIIEDNSNDYFFWLAATKPGLKKNIHD